GDLEYYPGDGQRLLFKRRPNAAHNEAQYEPPAGFYGLVEPRDNGYLMVLRDGTRLQFRRLRQESEGAKLITIKERHGLTMALAYDGQERLASVTDPKGHVFTYDYGFGQLAG